MMNTTSTIAPSQDKLSASIIRRLGCQTLAQYSLRLLACCFLRFARARRRVRDQDPRWPSRTFRATA